MITKPLDTHDYGFEVPPKSRIQLTRDAHTIHQLLGYRGDRPFPIVPFLEHVLPVLYEDFELEISTCGSLGDKFGETYPKKHLIRLREDIYDQAVEGHPFSRMTIAHEIGHLIEHENVPVALARNAASRQIEAYRCSEWQANAFAGALLMPASKILDLSIPEIMERYQVTCSAAQCQSRAVRKGVHACSKLTL